MQDEKLKKNDFIELEYVGKIKDTGLVFDTNIEQEAKKINIDIKTRPFIICIGQNMILQSIDEFLIGKQIGKYTLELPPEKAFGKRNRALIKTMPLSVFRQHNIQPQAGMIFTFDNLLGKISAISGGRVIVDFNNPVAGKEVVYELNIKKKITKQEEKIKSLMSIFFKKEFPFSVDNKKLVIKAPGEMKNFIKLFKDKFKEILNLELEIEENNNKTSKGKR
jgi:FKBP-type peptidyl-prolyl cis-trans isomerase 2